jgi:hypothetical protein
MFTGMRRKKQNIQQNKALSALGFSPKCLATRADCRYFVATNKLRTAACTDAYARDCYSAPSLLMVVQIS